VTQCLSVNGPPPGCGHVPTANEPHCAVCRESDRLYVKRETERAIREAQRLLQHYGYTVTAPHEPVI
jgi:hypothetical protein